MKFGIVTQNHGNPEEIRDIIRYLTCCIEATGHEVQIGACIGAEVMIVLEYFDNEFVEMVRTTPSLHRAFVLVVTEFPSAAHARSDAAVPITDRPRFNDFALAANMSPERYRNCQIVGGYARAVWCLAPGQAAAYQRMLGRPDVFELPHGYVDGFATVPYVPDARKDIDFLFTGGLTDHRIRVMNALNAAGHSTHVLPAASASYLRDHAVARAKVALNIRQTADWPHMSLGRTHYHLTNMSLMVSEHCAEAPEIASYVPVCDAAADFTEFCRAELAAGRFNARASAALARFRADWAMADRMRELLVMSGLETRDVAA